MKRMAIIILTLVPLAVFAAMPDIITINNTGIFKEKQRPPVKFSHAKHIKIKATGCADCHHTGEKKKGEPGPKGETPSKCNVCHPRPDDLQRAFHRQCIDCHNKAKQEGKVTGPRLCGECHTWKK